MRGESIMFKKAVRSMDISFIACACLIGLVACGVSFAAETEDRVNQWEVGPEVYYFQYKEPNFNIKTDGVMYGAAASFTHREPNHLRLKAVGNAALGGIYYHSTASGSISGIDDYTLEPRILAGYDIYPSKDLLLTPFFGVGYRYLNDDSSSMISSTGARGYERESNYFYSPVGVEFSGKLRDKWRLGLIAEYDIFWKGEQKSHLENALSGLNTVSNDQSGGYGFRGSLQLQKKGAQFDIVVEPFIRWWSIKDSQASNLTYTGVIVGYAYEPKYETLEAGARVAILF